ncbi:MAG TPA: YkvA family protein [Polyangiaceae bacterium]|jgi:uncharacterized membrane protein YkvA (DUF1232 family)
MGEAESRYLDAFPSWLQGLGDDARVISGVLKNKNAPEPVRKGAAAALNYLFRSLDLIPDGIEDLGYLDDAFVLRVAAAGLDAEALSQADGTGTLARLSNEAALIREFLESDYARLEKYVRGLEKLSARGRTAEDIVEKDSVLAEFVREVESWAGAYGAPSFNRDEKNLVKLRAFLGTKLPAAD